MTANGAGVGRRGRCVVHAVGLLNGAQVVLGGAHVVVLRQQQLATSPVATTTKARHHDEYDDEPDNKVQVTQIVINHDDE